MPTIIESKAIESEFIPLSVPVLQGNEWRYVKECLDTGWISSAGKYVEKFEEGITESFKVPHAVACINGTSALHMALKVVGVAEGNEVIVPTVTFIAPVNAVTYVGGKPIFMDCDDYYNIDAQKTIDFINKETVFRKGSTYNKKTKKKIAAMVVVHVFGNAVNLDPLVVLCQKRNIKLIEDATESLGTYYLTGKLKGRFTGTLGEVGCYSFNGNKIISAGGGGMLVSHSQALASKARYLTTQAKDNGIRYIHNEVGYNFRLNNIQAALGVAQLECLTKYIQIKKRNYGAYKSRIDSIDGLHLQEVPDYAEGNYWMYALRVDSSRYGRGVDDLIKLFAKEGIEVRPLWFLNHLQKPYKKAQGYGIEKAYGFLKKTFNIPCSVNLSKENIERIVGLLEQWKR